MLHLYRCYLLVTTGHQEQVGVEGTIECGALSCIR